MKDGTTQRLFYRENHDGIGYAARSRPRRSRRGAEWTSTCRATKVWRARSSGSTSGDFEAFLVDDSAWQKKEERDTSNAIDKGADLV